MKYLLRAVLPFALVLALTACTDRAGPVPTDVGGPTFMTAIGCDTTPWCGGGDPEPDWPGIYLGYTVTPSACFSPSGSGINDQDYDGMHDYCENILAEKFRPQLALSNYDCNSGREPYWAAKYFPAQGNRVRIMYLLSYYLDCGVTQPDLTCDVLNGFVNLLRVTIGAPGVLLGVFPVSNVDFCEGHHGDSEWVVVNLVYLPGSMHWGVESAMLSAHWGGLADASSWNFYDELEYPDRFRGYPRVWVAEGKHANYPTRTACNNRASETCESNVPRTRLSHNSGRNIGSLQGNLISPETCVASPNPYRTGVECFWRSGENVRFSGWDAFPSTADATPYSTQLVLEFECYSYYHDGSGNVVCSDRGVVRN